MTVVASASLSNGSHEHAPGLSSEQQSPPRFTAVNGREPPGPAFNGTADVNSAAPPQNHERHAPHERPPADVQLNSHASRDDPTTAQGPSSASSRNYDGRHFSYHINESPQKRKRSYSPERQVTPSEQYDSQRVSKSPESKAGDDSTPRPQTVDVNGSTRSSSASGSEAFARQMPSRYGPMERVEAAHSTSNASTWDSPNSHFSPHGQHHQQQPIDSSDAQLVEALQRDVQDSSTTAAKQWEQANQPQDDSLDSHAAQHSHSSAASPNYEHEQSQPPPSTTETETHGRQKKKRAFSNRTKTGCMTCRRRKKKCDEQHPQCNNCLRGGFTCEGYAVRSAWQKPMKPQTPVPLQSKDRYPEVANSYIQDVTVTSQRPDARAQSISHTDSGRARHLSVDDPDRSNMTQYLASPNGVPGNPWPRSSWPASGPGPSHFVSDHPSKGEMREAPPRNDISRAEQQKSEYQLAGPVRELPHGQHGKPPITGFQSNMEQRPGRPVHVELNYPAAANLALSTMEPQAQHQAHMTFEPVGKTEKAKMLGGEPYRPFDPELILDRERCAMALRRYNKAKDLASGISADEITRLLKQIVMGRTDFRPDGPLRSLGPGVVVEAPFRCNYGFNIHLGEDVMVSQNCFFADDCNIRIGAHTWIGPNVTILGAMAASGMSQRKGSRSLYQGAQVVIEEDCWIGPGSTILPGVVIGRGASVPPGEVVERTMAPYENTSKTAGHRR